LDAAKQQVKVAGRIQGIRRMGKAGFVPLIQEGEKLQIYIRKERGFGDRLQALRAA